MPILGVIASSRLTATSDMVLIQTTSLSSAQSSIVFNSLGAYEDLYLLISARGTHSANQINLDVSLNGSTSDFTSYSLQGNGAQSYANQNPSGGKNISDIPAATATANAFSASELYIYDYRKSSRKSLLATSLESHNVSSAEGSASSVYYNINWNNTATITSVTLSCGAGNLATGTTASIYGIS